MNTPLTKTCPRCNGIDTKQLTNFGKPIAGRYQCFGCKRFWDEIHPQSPDYVALESNKVADADEVKFTIRMSRDLYNRLRSNLTVRRLGGNMHGLLDSLVVGIFEHIEAGETEHLFQEKKDKAP